MKLTAYSKLLTMTKEALDKVKAPIQTRSAKKKAELEMLKQEEKLATIENEIQNLCSVKELDYEKILDKVDEQALVERRITQFRELIVQMFPDIAD